MNLKPKEKLVKAADGSTVRALQPDLRFTFAPQQPEAAVRQVIARHVGAENAISIEGIAHELWHFEWTFCRQDSKGNPLYPYRKQIERVVKSLVRSLRGAGVKIGSTRGARDFPAGYYMISNDRELAMTVKPMLSQAVDMLHTIEKLTGKGFYATELAGQQRLFEAGSGQ